MKALIKYLLLLCIIVLAGYSQLSAYTCKIGPPHTFIKNYKRPAHVGLDNDGHNQANIASPSTSSQENDTDMIEAEKNELEEDEHSESGGYVAAVFYAVTFGYFFLCLQKGISFYKYFSYITSSRRHIILCVIRI